MYLCADRVPLVQTCGTRCHMTRVCPGRACCAHRIDLNRKKVFFSYVCARALFQLTLNGEGIGRQHTAQKRCIRVVLIMAVRQAKRCYL